MCNKACLDFGAAAIGEGDIQGKRVLEVGSRDVNGTLRSITASFRPAEYVGVDIEQARALIKCAPSMSL